MAGEVLFEHDYRGYVWRLSINDFGGHSSADLRKWFYSDDGRLMPTREGLSIPLRRLPELRENIDLYLKQIAR